MNVGQLLGGAGVVGQGWREAEDAARRSQQLEMQTAELRRLENLQKQLAATQVPSFEPVDVAQFTQDFMPGQRMPMAPNVAAMPAQARPGAPDQSAAETARLNRAGLTVPPTAPAATGAEVSPVAPSPLVESRPPVSYTHLTLPTNREV